MEVKKTISRTYIVPLLSSYLDLDRGLFLNSYLYDINRPEYNIEEIKGIFLLIKWNSNEVHRQFEYKLINNALVKDHYDVDGEYYMVYTIFPSEIVDDVNKLIAGRYSTISALSKDKITRYWNQNPRSEIYMVLHKSAELRKMREIDLNVTIDYDAELGNIMDIKKETFQYLVKDKNINHL